MNRRPTYYFSGYINMNTVVARNKLNAEFRYKIVSEHVNTKLLYIKIINRYYSRHDNCTIISKMCPCLDKT